MNELINQIANDLRIYKFNDETVEEYGNRVIYSALVAWAKVQVLGTSYTDISKKNKEYPYITQRYLNEKLSFVQDGLISSIPHVDYWLSEENEKLSKVRYIIKNLIFCYQISKTCEKGYITALPKRKIYFKYNKLILGGTDWNSNNNNCYSVGLGVWNKNGEKNNINYKEIFNIPECTIEDYYMEIEKNALWKQDELSIEYEYFSGGSRLWHNKAWKTFNEKYIPLGISLIRKKNNPYEYKLFLLKNGKKFTAKLDEWYKNENEISRIMYALEYYRNKPAQFKAKKRKEFVELHCHSNLPNAERRIILMASWPKRKYCDDYTRIIPIFLWKDIEYILLNLGIEVVFE